MAIYKEIGEMSDISNGSPEVIHRINSMPPGRSRGSNRYSLTRANTDPEHGRPSSVEIDARRGFHGMPGSKYKRK